MTIGQRLKYARQKMGYKQTELAEKIGLTQSAISNIECDSSRQPSAPTLLKLAPTLEVSADWLMDGKGDVRGMPPLASEVEGELIEAFRALTPEAKGILLSVARAMRK